MAIQVSGGRVLQIERIVSAKVLRQDHAWCASGTGKSQCGCRVWGGDFVTAHTYTRICSLIQPSPSLARGQALSHYTHPFYPVPCPNTQARGGPSPPGTQSWISRAGTGRLWHQRSCPWGGGFEGAGSAPAWGVGGQGNGAGMGTEGYARMWHTQPGLWGPSTVSLTPPERSPQTSQSGWSCHS